MKFCYVHKDLDKVHKLYRRLRIIYNKIAELNDEFEQNIIEQFGLKSGITATIAVIKYPKDSESLVLDIQDKEGNNLFGLSIGRDDTCCLIKFSNLYPQEPEMFAIYIEQLETQVESAVKRLNEIRFSDYITKLRENLFE